MDNPPLPVEKQIFKSIGVIAILSTIIFCASSSILPLSLASVIGVTALIATRIINLREAFKAVEWNIVALIYAMLAVGLTMQKTGVCDLLAEVVLKLCLSNFQGEWQLILAIAVIYLITACLTELLSNNATIAILSLIHI